jgi:hypothetical protein
MANELTPKILAALARLDPADNGHWNSDGLPNTGTVQRLANDQTIKRSDIQTAKPGFDRAAAVAAPVEKAVAPTTAAPEPKPGLDSATKAEAVEAVAEVEISDAQLNAMLKKRVADAEAMIETGRAMVRDGTVMQENGLNAVNAARRDLHKYFPPMTAAENIKNHLRAETALRAARVQQTGAPSHLDALRRPGGSSVNRGFGPGRSAGTFNRKEAAKMGFVVPGSPAAAQQTAAREARAAVPGTKA